MGVTMKMLSGLLMFLRRGFVLAVSGSLACGCADSGQPAFAGARNRANPTADVRDASTGVTIEYDCGCIDGILGTWQCSGEWSTQTDCSANIEDAGPSADVDAIANNLIASGVPMIVVDDVGESITLVSGNFCPVRGPACAPAPDTRACVAPSQVPCLQVDESLTHGSWIDANGDIWMLTDASTQSDASAPSRSVDMVASAPDGGTKPLHITFEYTCQAQWIDCP
jgi:hypothetical protein